MSTQVLLFQSQLDFNLSHIRERLLTDSFEFGDYNYFKVFEPKERIISAAPFEQKVVHHAIINICHPYFERGQIYHNYACRLGKGVKRAINAVKDSARNSYYFLKLDFKKYFDSIDHIILYQMLNRLFKDASLLRLYCKLLDSYHVLPGRGLPIGNLTSQYFANHYLSGMDHHVIEKERPYRYYRYMDDTLYIDKSKKRLLDIYHSILAYSKDYLNLSLKQPVLGKIACGIPFLGYKIRENKISLLSKSKNRFQKKYMLYDYLWKQNILNEGQFQQKINALSAFIRQADVQKYLTKWIQFIES